MLDAEKNHKNEEERRMRPKQSFSEFHRIYSWYMALGYLSVLEFLSAAHLYVVCLYVYKNNSVKICFLTGALIWLNKQDAIECDESDESLLPLHTVVVV